VRPLERLEGEGEGEGEEEEEQEEPEPEEEAEEGRVLLGGVGILIYFTIIKHFKIINNIY